MESHVKIMIRQLIIEGLKWQFSCAQNVGEK